MKRVHYHLSSYVSHRTAGQANMAALELAGVPLAASPAEADVVVLHDDPLNWGALSRSLGLEAFAARGGKVIGYGVWETEILPLHYQEQLRHVHQVWTCSDFSARAFAPFCPSDGVRVVPHIAEAVEPGAAALDAMARRIGYEEGRFFFLTIADSVNPRKNLRLLLNVFAKHFARMDNAFLVVKQYRHTWDLSPLPNVVGIGEELPRDELMALHRLCHCYVSPHHAEAWGLSLSDAMAMGTPVVATGWSGNMHFMTGVNSYPVQYELAPVSEEMCSLIPLYTREMRWANPDPGHLAHLMRKVLRYWEKGQEPPVCQSAAQDMQAFSPENVGQIMRAAL